MRPFLQDGGGLYGLGGWRIVHCRSQFHRANDTMLIGVGKVGSQQTAGAPSRQSIMNELQKKDKGIDTINARKVWFVVISFVICTINFD